MQETKINGIHLSLAGPEKLPLSMVLRSSPTYDGSSNFYTVSLRNDSNRNLKLPFDELSRNTVTKYRDMSTSAEFTDNRTPPPKLDGAVEQFTPGEIKTFQVVFEYPLRIATMNNGIANILFCVKWEGDWLRKSSYVNESFDWNESFELCREICIVDKTQLSR